MNRAAVAYLLFVIVPILAALFSRVIARSRRWQMILASAATSSIFGLLLYSDSDITSGFAIILIAIAAVLGLAASGLAQFVARKAGTRNLTCPYCGHVAIQPFRKSLLGAARTVACKSCGNRVSISLRAAFGVVPLFVAGLVAALFESSTVHLALITTGIIGAFLFHVYAVPLVPRQRRPEGPRSPSDRSV